MLFMLVFDSISLFFKKKLSLIHLPFIADRKSGGRYFLLIIMKTQASKSNSGLEIFFASEETEVKR